MLKQILYFGLLSSITCFASASPQQSGVMSQQQYQYLNYAVAVEYASYEMDFHDQSEAFKFDGVSFGVSTVPYYSGWYGKFDALTNKETDARYYELVAGSQLNLINYYGFYMLASVGLGYSWLEAESLDNTINFVTLPVGVEAGISIIPELTLYGNVGYKWVWDTTSKARCRDGSLTNFTGNGRCDWNGGVDYFRDSLGDNSGVTYGAGIKYLF